MRRSENSKWNWIGFKKSPVCHGRRTTTVDRERTFGIKYREAMSADGTVEVRPVLRTTRRDVAESRTDAAAGRTVHEDTVLRCAENDRGSQEARLHRQSEASPAT